MAAGKKIGLFGGTFDPIHRAHLTVAREATALAGLDEVLFVPAGKPPHKTEAALAPYEDRYRMVELACAGVPEFRPSRLEEGGGMSYSMLTIEKLRQQSDPADRIFFLIGADAFAEIPTWHRWQEVVRAVEFIVATRPGHDYKSPTGARIHRLETLALPVSSSDVRARLAAGEDPPELPDSVLTYIRDHGLYRTAEPGSPATPADEAGKHP